jgi:hypothetical protein
MNLANNPPPFVSTFRDRHGVMRPRFRRAGFSRYLPTAMESEEFRAAYEACLAEAPPTPIRSPKSAVGQFRSLMRLHGWSGKGEFIYFVAAKRMVKIGFSGSIIMRLNQLASQSPTRLRLLAAMPGGVETERRLHAHFADDRIKGEWFRYSDRLKAVAERVRKTGTFVDID